MTGFAVLMASSVGYSQTVSSFSGSGSYNDPTNFDFRNEFGSGLLVTRGQTITDRTTCYDENGSSIPNQDPSNVPDGSTVRRVVIIKQKSKKTNLILGKEKDSIGEDNIWTMALSSKKTEYGLVPIAISFNFKSGTLINWERPELENDLAEFRYTTTTLIARESDDLKSGEFTINGVSDNRIDPDTPCYNLMPALETFSEHFEFDENADGGIGSWAFTISSQIAGDESYNTSQNGSYNTSQSGSFSATTVTIPSSFFSYFWGSYAGVRNVNDLMYLLWSLFSPEMIRSSDWTPGYIFEYQREHP